MYSGLLIGNIAEIVESRDKTLLGTKGTVVDETENVVMIQKSGNRTIRVPKSVVAIKLIESRGKIVTIAGSDLVATPQERIKG